MSRTVIVLCSLFFLNTPAFSQQLKAGFDKDEYIDLMKVSAQFGDSAYAASIPPPKGYKLVYASPAMGLDNRWHLWKTEKGVGIISIRGTTHSETSWLANFYAAMVPAKGEMRLSDSSTFHYTLAENPRAAVHVGWLTGMAFIAKDMLPKLDSCYKRGMKRFYIIGHSQGGAIAYLLTAYLRTLQEHKEIPRDAQFKTYCSAGPKPGNVYFAYEYEAMTQHGWAFNVVNAEDWVPQSFFSVQTSNDFTAINPFQNARTFIRHARLPKRWALNYAYGRLTKPARRTQRNYQKFLGRHVQKAIAKKLPGYEAPPFANTGDYVRTGVNISLVPKADYYIEFPQQKENTFRNHLHAAYIYLARQITL